MSNLEKLELMYDHTANPGDELLIDNAIVLARIASEREGA